MLTCFTKEYSVLDSTKFDFVDDSFAALTKYSTKTLAWPQTRPGQQDPSRADQLVTQVTLSFKATYLQTTTAIFLHDLLSRQNLHERPFSLTLARAFGGLILSTPPIPGPINRRHACPHRRFRIQRCCRQTACSRFAYWPCGISIPHTVPRLRSIRCGEPPISFSLATFVRSREPYLQGNPAARTAWCLLEDVVFPLGAWEEGMPHPSSPSSSSSATTAKVTRSQRLHP